MAPQSSPLSGTHGYPVVKSLITNSLNTGEVIVRSVREIHSWTNERLFVVMFNSNLSRTTFRPRSSGISMVPDGYLATRT